MHASTIVGHMFAQNYFTACHGCAAYDWRSTSTVRSCVQALTQWWEKGPPGWAMKQSGYTVEQGRSTVFTELFVHCSFSVQLERIHSVVLRYKIISTHGGSQMSRSVQNQCPSHLLGINGYISFRRHTYCVCISLTMVYELFLTEWPSSSFYLFFRHPLQNVLTWGHVQGFLLFVLEPTFSWSTV